MSKLAALKRAAVRRAWENEPRDKNGRWTKSVQGLIEKHGETIATKALVAGAGIAASAVGGPLAGLAASAATRTLEEVLPE